MFMRFSFHPVVTLALLLFACGSEAESTPPNTDRPPVDGGPGDGTGSVDADSPDASEPTDTHDAARGDTHADVDRPSDVDNSNVADVSDVVSSEACYTDDGCYDCIPIDEITYLNACSDSACTPFDNRTRLPLLNGDGTLPPLP